MKSKVQILCGTLSFILAACGSKSFEQRDGAQEPHINGHTALNIVHDDGRRYDGSFRGKHGEIRFQLVAYESDEIEGREESLHDQPMEIACGRVMTEKGHIINVQLRK